MRTHHVGRCEPQENKSVATQEEDAGLSRFLGGTPHKTYAAVNQVCFKRSKRVKQVLLSLSQFKGDSSGVSPVSVNPYKTPTFQKLTATF